MTYQHLHNCFRLILLFFFFFVYGADFAFFFFSFFLFCALSVCVHLQLYFLNCFMSPCRVDLLIDVHSTFLLLRCMEESIYGGG